MSQTWLSPQQAGHAWAGLIAAPWYDPYSKEKSKQNQQLEDSALAALAWAPATGVALDEPVVLPSGPARPLLHHNLHRLTLQHQGVGAAPVGALPLDPTQGPGDHRLPARERLAAKLIQMGADPWLKDADGWDALDWAIQANARSLVKALLAHPGCPPMPTLVERTAPAGTRRAPWVHALVHQGRMGLAHDLLAAGWDIKQADRQGWTAVAWVMSAAALADLLERQAPLTSGERDAVVRAWAQRAGQGSALPQGLRQTLERLQPASREEKAQAQRLQQCEAWLAVTPNKPLHKLAAAGSWSGLTDGSLAAWITDNMTWRRPAGTSRARNEGNWSLLTACVWGWVRQNSGAWQDRIQPHPAQKMVPLLDTVLQRLEPQERARWLNEPIRAGLTNRAFLAWAVGAVASPILAAELGDNGHRRLENATTAVLALCQSGAPSNWHYRLAIMWNNLVAAEAMREKFPAWCWEALSRLAASNLQLAFDQRTYAAWCRRATECLLAPPEGLPLETVVNGAWALLRANPNAIWDENYQHEQSKIAVAHLWPGLEAVGRKAPHLLADRNLAYPYETLAKHGPPGRLMLAGQRVVYPTEHEWNAWVNAMRLQAKLPSAPTPRRGPRL